VNSQQVDDFFSGGVPLVVQNQLLALPLDDATKSLINGFFSIGISDVIRQILVGPDPDPDAPPAPDAKLQTINIAAVQDVAGKQDPDPTPVVNAALKDNGPAPVVVDKKAKIAKDPVQVVQPVSAPVASPPPAGTSAPVAPVVVKDEDPVVKPVVKDTTKDSNDVTDDIVNGNKVEVDPILLVGANGRGPKAGEGSWGVFGQVADAIGKAVSGAVAPKKTPAKTEGASTGSADGS
jgi:hypothetical protein